MNARAQRVHYELCAGPTTGSSSRRRSAKDAAAPPQTMAIRAPQIGQGGSRNAFATRNGHLLIAKSKASIYIFM
jgi:hypothetical protein